MLREQQASGLSLSDVFRVFTTLGTIAVSRSVAIDIEIDGGTSLILQSHIKECAADVDMRFLNVTDANGVLLNHQEKATLEAEFCAQRSYESIIDQHYAPFFNAKIVKKSRIEPEKIFFTSLLNQNGHGVHIHLTTLAHMLFSKGAGLYYHGENKPYAQLHPKLQSWTRDAYGLYKLLNAEWQRDVPLYEDIHQARFYLGLEPKWRPYASNYPAPIPDNAQELEMRAGLGRQCINKQRFALNGYLTGTGLKQKISPRHIKGSARIIQWPGTMLKVA